MIIEYMKNSKIGVTELDNKIEDMTYELSEAESKEFSDSVYQRAGENIRTLDSRFVWEPETSTLYWERTSDSEEAPAVETEDILDAIDRAFEFLKQIALFGGQQ
jgi:hypothetical protein